MDGTKHELERSWRQQGRFLLACIATVSLGLVANGCGSSSASDQVVAKVSGIGEITNATLEHWMPAQAILVYALVPTVPPPAGVVPDPPGYSACISFLAKYLAALPTATARGAPPSSSALKGDCRKHEQQLRVTTLNTLIGWDWILGQGKLLGLYANEAEARARVKTVYATLFQSGGNLRDYMKWTHQSYADLVFRSRVQVVEAKLRESLLAASARIGRIANAKARAAATTKLEQALLPSRHWLSKTSCISSLIVSSCREYKGATAPGTPD